jgi:hypothetical protein
LRVLSAIRPDVGLAFHRCFVASHVGSFNGEGTMYRAPTKELECMNHVKITSGSPY